MTAQSMANLLGIWFAMTYAKLLDLATTHAVLATGGTEVNPLSNAIIASVGMPGLWLKAAVALAFVLALMLRSYGVAKTIGKEALIPAAFTPVLMIAAFPGAWNLWQLAYYS